MSSFSINIFRYSLLPAALIILGKVGGILLVNLIFNYDYFVDFIAGDSFVTKIFFYDPEHTYLATNVSNGLALLFLVVGQVIMAIKLLYLNDLESNPKTLVRIIHLKLTDFLTSVDKLYPMVIAWLLFSWVLVLIILHDVSQQNTSVWLGGISLITSIAYTWVIMRNIEFRLQTIYKEQWYE